MRQKLLYAAILCSYMFAASATKSNAGLIRTDVEPPVVGSENEGAGEGEIDDEITEDGEIEDTEPQIVFMEAEGKVSSYQKGDLPFVIQEDNVVISYNIIHADGTVEQLTAAGFETYYHKYVERTGDDYPHFGDLQYFTEERTRVVKENASSEEDMMLKLAISVSNVTAIPEPEDIRWYFITKEDVTHYIYYDLNSGKIYEVSEETYNHYQQLDLNWFDRDQIIDTGSIGYGNVSINLDVSKRLQGETLVVSVYSYQDGEEKSALVNAPYRCALSLEEGRYVVTKVSLFDDPELLLDYDTPEFAIYEHKEIIVPVKASDPMDSFELNQIDPEQIEAANAPYYEDMGNDIEENTTIAATDVTTPEPQEKTIPIWLFVIGGVAVFIVGGIAYVIWQRRQYEY